MDLRLRDAVRPEQLRGCHVDRAVPGASGRCVGEARGGRLQRDHAGRAEVGGDLPRDRLRFRRGHLWPGRAGLLRVSVRDAGRGVDDELAGREVGACVVEAAAEAGRAHHADDDRDQRAEADGRQRRAGSRPETDEVPQRQPDRDRGPAAGGGDHGQESRSQQHDGDGERDETDDELPYPVSVPSGRAGHAE